MNARSRSLYVALVIASVAAVGCHSDSPSPTALRGPTDISVDFSKKVKNSKTSDTSTVVSRVTPLASDVTVSAVIGSAGGTLELPAAGIKLTVPAGAVSSDQTFSITAMAGDMIAYEFAPHMAFAQPLQIEQKLNVLVIPADLSTVSLGYFASRSDLGLTDTDVGTIQEALPVTFDVTGNKARASVVHFSGYLMASGRSAHDDRDK